MESDSDTILNQLLEQYAEAMDRGDSAAAEDCLGAFPEFAEAVRGLFPVYRMLEDARHSQPSFELADSAGSGPPTQAGQAALGPGDRLGDYRLLKVIGRGGMGIVYEAEHLLLSNRVAVKTLPVALERPKWRERFLREASAAARMHHPNIVPVFDFGSSDSTLYYVMPLIRGCGLNQLVRNASHARSPNRSLLNDEMQRGGTQTAAILPDTIAERTDDGSVLVTPRGTGVASRPQSTRHGKGGSSVSPTPGGSHVGSDESGLYVKVARWGRDAADGLAYAHDAGVIHRDIKPSNLMLDGDERVYITDFGLAKISDEHDLTGSADLLGTLRYMPPEAFSGNTDGRGDLYGLGLTLYELLAGGPAIEESDQGQILKAITEGRIQPLRCRVPGVPSDLAKVIHKSIESDPEQRYRDANEFRDDLGRFLKGEPVAARSASLAYVAYRWVGRHRVVSALALGLLLMLVGISVAATINAQRFRTLAEQRESALIDSRTSDADGWSFRNRPGHRKNGLALLQQAIDASKSDGSFEDRRSRFQTVAASLVTKDDAAPTFQWRHSGRLSVEEALAFSGDFQKYIWCDQRDESRRLHVYDRTGESYQYRGAVPLPASFGERGTQISSDGRYAANMLADQSLGLVDLQQLQFIESGFLLASDSAFDFHDQTSSLTLITDGRSAGGRSVVTISLPDLTVISEFTLDLPEFNAVTVGPRGERAAVHVANAYLDEITARIISLVDGTWTDLPVEAGLRDLAWHPDGEQIAVASDQLLIFDLNLRKEIQRIPASHGFPTEIAWAAAGQILVSSGADQQTRLFRPSTGREVLRLGRQCTAVSDDGFRLICRSGSELQELTLSVSGVVKEFESDGKRNLSGSVICDSYLLASDDNGFFLADLARSFVLERSYQMTYGVTVRPQQDEALITTDDGILALPITTVDESDALKIGPAYPLVLNDLSEADDRWATDDVLACQIDWSGSKLALTRYSGSSPAVASVDYETLSGVRGEARFPSDGCQANPHRPLLVTSVLTSPGIDVIDTRDGSIVFRGSSRPAYAEFTPDGERLIVSSDQQLSLYRVEDWSLIAKTSEDVQFESGATFAISPGGGRVAIESRTPRGVLFLDSSTLRNVLFLAGDPNDLASQVMPRGFDSSGKWLVTKRGDRTIACWNLAELAAEFRALGLSWPLGELGRGEAAIRVREANVDLQSRGQSRIVQLQSLDDQDRGK